MIFKPSLPTFWARRHLLAGTAAAAALGLLGCGGGGGAGISDSLAGVGSGGTGSFAGGPIRGFGCVIINNVGISRFSPLVETSVEEFDRILATNLRPAFITSRAKRMRFSCAPPYSSMRVFVRGERNW